MDLQSSMLTSGRLSVKVGDLVKYQPTVQGMEGMVGLVVGYNGTLPIIQWNNGTTVAEPAQLIEVINESR
jgi:hypothetical protein